MSKIRINVQHIANIVCTHEYATDIYQYIPSKKKRILSFSFSNFLKFKEIITKDKIICFGQKVSETELQDFYRTYVVRDNVVCRKSKVSIFVSGQDTPYVKHFATNQDADDYYNEISLRTSSIKSKKNHKPEFIEF